MNNEKLRADIKRELNRPTSMKKLAELLNRCYAALGEQQSVPEGWQSIVLLECESDYAERPSAPTWNGEGLPPVGIKCEFYLGGDEWCRAFTVGIDDDGCMVVQTKNDGYKCSLSPLHFRPISASSARG